MSFRKTLRGKTTWTDFEEYVGHKMNEGDKMKRFILDYFNRDFEQPYDDDKQCITTRIICKRDEQGYLKVLDREANKEAIKQKNAEYREANKEAIKQKNADYYADYYEKNKETIRQRRVDYYQRNKQSKKFSCDSCKIVCGSNHDLQKHFESKKHREKNKICLTNCVLKV